MPAFQDFTAPLIGLPVSHVWQGHGSALFLEFGRLSQIRRRDGRPAESAGEMGLMLEWSWRIEGKRSILCGSDSDEPHIRRALSCIRDHAVAAVTLTSRLPEIDIGFSSGAHLVSFMTADGQPQWTLFDRRTGNDRWMFVRAGRLAFGSAA